MKLLQVATFAHPDHAGGAERVVGEVARGLASRGHDVELITGVWGAAPSVEQHGSLRIHRFELERGAVWRSARRGVRRLLKQGVGAEAETVHLHQTATALPALRSRFLRGKPRLLSFYAPYHLEYLARYRDGRPSGKVALKPRVLGRALRRADAWLLDQSDAILVLSEFSREQVSAMRPKLGPRCLASTGGVDLAQFQPASQEAERRRTRERFGLANDAPLVLSVRRMVPRMGLADLVTALTHLAPSTQLALAGDGPERERLAELARELGLANRVHLLGRVEDDALPALYASADAFVLPTRSLEGFGLVTAEALASGVPVVATRVGATTNWLGERSFARLVPPEDPAAIATALRPWLEDLSAARQAGAQGRAHAEATLGWEHHVGDVERALESIRRAAS